MKEELIELARILMKMVSKQQKGVISQYISSVNSNRYNNARIIADEMMDCFIEEDVNGRKAEIASKLYDKTMEFYEINS